MPILTNSRHERFAQELAAGKTADEASQAVGLALKPCMDLAGYYVYMLVDPRDGHGFYIGKGKGRRYAMHWQEMLTSDVRNARKFTRLREIAKSGQRVQEFCIADGLGEPAAYALERELIRIVGFDVLTNAMPGVRSDLERAYVSGRDLVERIWPFEEWLNRAKRTDYEISLYHRVKAALVENTDRLSQLVSL